MFNPKTTLIILLLASFARTSFVNYVTSELVKTLEKRKYDEVFSRLCRIRVKGDCFPDLENALAKGTEDNMRISELSTNGAYRSAIYRYKNVFAIKHVMVESEDMLKYALLEINTGIKVKESMSINPIESLVPIEQCCAVKNPAGTRVLYNFFLRLPFFKYTDLRTVMAERKYVKTTESLTWALNICLGLVDAVSILHAKDYAHRDIKPENILMKTLYNPQLTDFGFAKKILDSTTTILGTDFYMAPELFTKQGYTTKVDIHNLGIVFFEVFGTHIVNIQKGIRRVIRSYCINVEPLVRAPRNRQSIYCAFFHPLIVEMVQEKPGDRPDISNVINNLNASIEAYWNHLNKKEQNEFFAAANDFMLDANNLLKMFLINLKTKIEQKKLPAFGIDSI